MTFGAPSPSKGASLGENLQALQVESMHVLQVESMHALQVDDLLSTVNSTFRLRRLGMMHHRALANNQSVTRPTRKPSRAHSEG
jgi:hypothetical protein